jgi:hypothetical protein
MVVSVREQIKIAQRTYDDYFGHCCLVNGLNGYDFA